jgi:hypothetical protein
MSLVARAGVPLRVCLPSMRESAVRLERRIDKKDPDIDNDVCSELMTTVDTHRYGQNWHGLGGKGKQLEAGRWRIGNLRLQRRICERVLHALSRSISVPNVSLAIPCLFLHRAFPGKHSDRSIVGFLKASLHV